MSEPGSGPDDGPGPADDTGAPDRWDRPLHVPGGGDAFVWFVVFNTEADDLDVDPDRYRVEEIPDGIDVFDVDEPFVESVFGPPMGDVLRERDPLTAALAEVADRAILVTGTVIDPPTLDYLRDIVGIVTAALDTGGVAVLSLQSLTLFSPDQWRELIFDGERDLARHLVAVLYSDPHEGTEDEAGTLWVHTRGLRLFGRPDLSLRDIPAEQLGVARTLFHALSDRLARGLIIEDGARMDIGPPVGPISFRLAGDLDDPEFNNVHLEIDWPSGSRATEEGLM